jgi:hypothetical protein
VLAIMLVGGGVVLGFSLARGTKGDLTPAVGQASGTSNPPSPTLSHCIGYESSAGQRLTISLTVPEGCILIIDAYQGQISGYSWDKGGVAAFPSGTYTGYIVDGAYQLYDAPAGKTNFCKRYKQDITNNHPITSTKPLDGWTDWMSAC